MLRRLLSAVTCTALLAACGAGGTHEDANGEIRVTVPPTTGPSPSPDLQAELATWQDFPAGAHPRPLVVLQTDSGGGWHTGAAKFGFLDGDWADPTHLPSSPTSAAGYPMMSARQALDLLRASESGGRTGPVKISITGVTATTGVFHTDRGPLRLPAWRVDVTDEVQPFLVAAVATPARYGMPPPEETGFGAFAANGDPASTQVTVRFEGGADTPGPCGHDYRVETAESTTAAVYRVIEIPRPPLANTPGYNCTLEGYIRAATVHLNTPLGGRVLLRDDHGHGVPTEVTPQRAGGGPYTGTPNPAPE